MFDNDSGIGWKWNTSNNFFQNYYCIEISGFVGGIYVKLSFGSCLLSSSRLVVQNKSFHFFLGLLSGA